MNSIIYRTKSWHARIWRRKTPREVPVFEGSLKKERRFLNMFLLNTNLLHISVWRPQVSVQHWSFIKCFCSCTKFPQATIMCLNAWILPPRQGPPFSCGGYPGDPAWSFIGFGRQCYPWVVQIWKRDFFGRKKVQKGMSMNEMTIMESMCVGVKKINISMYIYIYVHMLSCNYIHMYIFEHRGIVMGHLLERVSPPKCQTNRSLKVSKSPRVTTSQQSLWKHHISRPSAIPTEKFHGYPFCPFKSKGNPSSHLKASGMTMTSTVEATPSTGPFLTSLFLCQVLSLQCRMLWCLKNRCLLFWLGSVVEIQGISEKTWDSTWSHTIQSAS